MASTKFQPVPGVGRQRKFLVEEKRYPSHLRPPPQLSSREQLQLRPGQRGLVPKGTDRLAPRPNRP